MARKLNIVDQRLAAKSHQLQVVRIQAADAIGWDIQRGMMAHVTRAIALTTRAVKFTEPWTSARRAWLKTQFREIFADMMDEAQAHYNQSLREFATVSYDWASKLLIRALPRVYMRSIVPTALVGEATADNPPITPKKIIISRKVFDKYVAPALEVESYVEPVSEAGRMSDAEFEAFAQEVIFPPLTLSEIETMVESDQWLKTFPGNLSKFNDPVFRDRLVEGIAGGQNVEELTRSIRDLEAGVYWKARRTARTESLRVAEMAQRETWDDLGEMMEGAQILAVLDQNTRPEHAARNGQIYSRDPKAGELPFDELPILPDAPNSVVPGMFIQGEVVAASKAGYTGQVTELVTAAGRRCTVTLNHPVLTSKGFIRAGSIREGEYLVAYKSDRRGDILRPDDVQNKPARIEQVFRALRQVRPTVRSPAAFRDFHGDAEFFYSKVEIVAPAWELLGDGESASAEFVRDLVFEGAKQLGGSRSSDGSLGERGVAVRNAGVSVATAGSDFVNVAGVAVKAKFCRIGPAANLDVAFLESRGDKLAGDAERAGQLVEGFPGVVAFDRVVSVKRFHYVGPVYDVQTDTGVMVANCRNDGNGLVISNCRCWTTPVLVPPDEVASDPGLTAIFENTAGLNIPDPAAYDKWFDQADEGARKLAVGSVRYNDVAGMLEGVRKPEWTDFIDPKTGSLLSRNEISRETDAEREARKKEAEGVFRQREALLRQVAARGYLSR